MYEFESVQRGIIFTFFMYSLIMFLFFVVKMVKNRVDKDAGLTDEQEGGKYVQKTQQNKQDGDIGASKDKLDTTANNKKPKPATGLTSQQATMNDLVIKVTKQQNEVDENDPLVIKLAMKFRHHIFYHLPFFFPVALNVATGTSYAFLFVLFFFLQVTFGLFNDLKIHHRCTENRILRIILEHLGYILSFFAWVNLWGANTSPSPFVIVKKSLTTSA